MDKWSVGLFARPGMTARQCLVSTSALALTVEPRPSTHSVMTAEATMTDVIDLNLLKHV